MTLSGKCRENTTAMSKPYSEKNSPGGDEPSGYATKSSRNQIMLCI